MDQYEMIVHGNGRLIASLRLGIIPPENLDTFAKNMKHCLSHKYSNVKCILKHNGYD